MIRRHQGSQGFGLIEVLVSLLVLGIGILGMVGLQLNAMKLNQIAAVRSQANFLAYDMADRMRANANAAQSGAYSTSFASNAPSGNSIAEQDLAQWKNALVSQLPSGAGAVSIKNNIVRITVQWDESKVGGASTQQYVFETRLCEGNCQ